MTEEILNAHINFQIADFDDDMIGICKSLVDWMKIIKKELKEDQVPENIPPDNYYKLDPHLPRIELRQNIRNSVWYATKKQKETDLNIKLKNIYVILLATSYIYHMPIDRMVESIDMDKEFTRDDAKFILLKHNMSPNWIKEPSGRDFTAILL